MLGRFGDGQVLRLVGDTAALLFQAGSEARRQFFLATDGHGWTRMGTVLRNALQIIGP